MKNDNERPRKSLPPASAKKKDGNSGRTEKEASNSINNRPVFPRYLVYDLMKISGIPAYLWFRPKRIFYSEKARRKIKGGALLISNHASYADPIVIMMCIWYRRHHFICTKDFYEGKSRFIFRLFQCIPIDKQNFGMDSFRVITEHLKNGELVSMFPEGQVGAGKEIDQFKSGMILMSVMSRKPIIPVYIKKREHFYERTVCVVGESVDICGLYGERPSMPQIEEAAKMLHDKEEELKKLAVSYNKYRR